VVTGSARSLQELARLTDRRTAFVRAATSKGLPTDDAPMFVKLQFD